jgi:hypothetical protein
VEAQGNLFEKKTINEKEDSFKEFLKMLFRACERVYSSRVVKEAFNEWEIEKEIEKQMEENAQGEIEQEDDF